MNRKRLSFGLALLLRALWTMPFLRILISNDDGSFR